MPKSAKVLIYVSMVILAVASLDTAHSLWIGMANDTVEIWAILLTMKLLLLLRLYFISRLFKNTETPNLDKVIKRFAWLSFSAMMLMLLGGPFFIIAASLSFLTFLTVFLLCFINGVIIGKHQSIDIEKR